MSGVAGRFDPVYAGCKGFMHALSKALAVDLGKFNVRVNTVAPGWIVPERTEEVSEGSFWMTMQDKFGTPDSFNAEYERTGKLHASGPLPLHRLGRPRDIANAAVYLASDAARHATGQLLSICGGVNMPS
jgi:3-oxoacyl-[acyl-carrier protein] reductase